MVKMVLSRPYHQEDQFTTSILRHWAAKHDDLLGEHIKALLIKNNNMPRKRQRSLQTYFPTINPLPNLGMYGFYLRTGTVTQQRAAVVTWPTRLGCPDHISFSSFHLDYLYQK